MKTKLDQFISRNQKRNTHLYQHGLVAGHDYVVCPVSGERLSMIKDNYITKILRMNPSEYPDVQRICQKRKENIKIGLHQIDSTTGLSKYETGQQKARSILKEVDSNGISGYKKKGEKTRATHMANIDEMGRNGYRRQADYRLTTILPNGLSVEQNAHIKQKDKLIASKISGTGGASKLSKRILRPILDFLDANDIAYYFDSTEYGIKDIDSGNYYFYDLTITKFNIAIEYQSAAWHANPMLSEDEWNRWSPPRGKKKTAKEVLQYDYNKAKALYKNRGIVTYYVWQQTQDTTIEELLCLLKTLIMKS